MGTYTAQEHIDIFGGLPERGEAAIDIRELADRQRDEFPWQTVDWSKRLAPSRPTPPCGSTCGPEGCMARGCPVGQDVDREDTYTASEAAADAAIDRDYFEAHEHDDLDLLRDGCEPFEDDDEDER